MDFLLLQEMLLSQSYSRHFLSFSSMGAFSGLGLRLFLDRSLILSGFVICHRLDFVLSGFAVWKICRS